MIAWNKLPEITDRLVELASEGFTQPEIAKFLWEEFPEIFPERPTRDAVKNAYARNLNRGKIQERSAKFLYNEHANSGLHTGDNYVEGCPTCYPPEDGLEPGQSYDDLGIPSWPEPKSFIGLTLGFFDIETTFSTQPIMLYGAIADSWGNVQQFYKGRDITDDRELVNSYARALEEYDILVGWNSKAFDVPVLSGRLAYHRLRPLIKGKHVDLMWYSTGSSMRIGKRSLQSVSEYFNTNNKKSPLTVRIWDKAMSGSEEDYRLIQEHCDADVLVLREVFGSLKDQIQNIHR